MTQDKKKLLSTILIILMFLIAAISIGRILTKGLGERAIDFHSFWYAGHFIWQGVDPYKAQIEGMQVRLPYQYLDGPTAAQEPPMLWVSPGNTAPFVLAVSLLSLFSWPVAFKAWAAINLILGAAIVWLVLRLLGRRMRSREGLVLLATFFSFISMRAVLEYGQTSVFVLTFMLVALLLIRRSPLLAGAALGIALSKYSLTFPVLLLFLYQRRWKAIGVSIAVQLAGIAAIAWLGNSTPQDVLAEYARIQLGMWDSNGIHLRATLLKDWGPWAYAVLVPGSLAVFALLARCHKSRRAAGRVFDHLTELHLVSIIMLWSLLAVYHRFYDNTGAILFVALVIIYAGKPVDQEAAYQLSSRQRAAVYAITGVVAVIWILPAYLVVGDVPYTYLFALSNLAALVLSVWLIFKIEPQAATMRRGAITQEARYDACS